MCLGVTSLNRRTWSRSITIYTLCNRTREHWILLIVRSLTVKSLQPHTHRRHTKVETPQPTWPTTDQIELNTTLPKENVVLPRLGGRTNRFKQKHCRRVPKFYDLSKDSMTRLRVFGNTQEPLSYCNGGGLM